MHNTSRKGYAPINRALAHCFHWNTGGQHLVLHLASSCMVDDGVSVQTYTDTTNQSDANS